MVIIHGIGEIAGEEDKGRRNLREYGTEEVEKVGGSSDGGIAGDVEIGYLIVERQGKKIHALFFVFYVLYFPLYITMQGALYPKRSVISQALSAEMVLYLNKVEQVTGAVT